MQNKFSVLFRGPTYFKCFSFFFFLWPKIDLPVFYVAVPKHTVLQVNMLHLKPLGKRLFIWIIVQYAVVTTHHSLWQHFLPNNRELLWIIWCPICYLSTTHIESGLMVLNNTVVYFTGVRENVLFFLLHIHYQCYRAY